MIPFKKTVVAVTLSVLAVAAVAGGVLSKQSAAQKEDVSRDYRCATPEKTPVEIERIERTVRKMQTSRRSAAREAGTVIIPVRFHVITTSTGLGNITNAQIVAQIKVLNTAYSGKDTAATHRGQGPSAQATANTPFRFRLVGITRTQNNDWYFNANLTDTGADNASAVAMKTALRQGGSGTLNVYSVGFNDGTLGYASFPDEYAGSPNLDGVVLLDQTLPGGTESPYDYGDTLTHEAGHWLGLFHTWQGGCATNPNTGGDLVADTPAQGSAFIGLPQAGSPRNTCTTIAGRDPVENFMDYTDDDGMFQFTAGQSVRMDTLAAAFRGPN